MFNFSDENNGKQKVLFIHGFASNENSINKLKNLPRDFDLISLRLPFKKDILGNDIKIENYIKYVNKFILEKKLDDFIVVGHSLGGAIALGINGAKGRILIAPLNPYLKAKKEWLLPKNLDQSKEAIENLFFKNDMHNENFINAHLNFANSHRDDLKYIVNNEISNIDFLQGYLKELYMKNKFIVIQGINDKYVTFDSIKNLSKDLEFKLSLIENCGHSPIYEKPQIVIGVINNFIEEVNN